MSKIEIHSAVFKEEVFRVVGLEEVFSCEEEMEDHSHREDIRGKVGKFMIGRELKHFWRHISWSSASDEGVIFSEVGGEAEISDYQL